MKKFAIELKWGIIFTLFSIVWMFFEKLMGWHSIHIDKHPVYTNLFAIPAVAIVVFALLDKRKNLYNNKMNWISGFLTGLVITVIIAVLNPPAQYIILKWITPEYFANAAKFAVDSGKMTAEQAYHYFNLISYMQQSTFGTVLMGVITSAIVALFVRKK